MILKLNLSWVFIFLKMLNNCALWQQKRMHILLRDFWVLFWKQAFYIQRCNIFVGKLKQNISLTKLSQFVRDSEIKFKLSIHFFLLKIVNNCALWQQKGCIFCWKNFWVLFGNRLFIYKRCNIFVGGKLKQNISLTKLS